MPSCAVGRHTAWHWSCAGEPVPCRALGHSWWKLQAVRTAGLADGRLGGTASASWRESKWGWLLAEEALCREKILCREQMSGWQQGSVTLCQNWPLKQHFGSPDETSSALAVPVLCSWAVSALCVLQWQNLVPASPLGSSFGVFVRTFLAADAWVRFQLLCVAVALQCTSLPVGCHLERWHTPGCRSLSLHLPVDSVSGQLSREAVDFSLWSLMLCLLAQR